MNATQATPEHTADSKAPAVDRGPVWKRGGYMLLFAIAFYVAQGLLVLAALVQFVTIMVMGKPNGFIADFGRSMAIWLAEVTAFQTAATENRPFPFAAWPSAD
ncbi:MAG: DUF4389 domain-containing protein [Pseudomonadota bacterium]